MSGRQLILLRHAKSSWADPGQADHERPLSGRGRRQTDAVARWLQARDAEPDLVLCSSALRTRETWERMRTLLHWEVPVEVEPALYLADAAAILEQVAAQGGAAGRVLVLGHNPGISQAAGALARREIELRTACLAWLEADGAWERQARLPLPAARLLHLSCPEREPADEA